MTIRVEQVFLNSGGAASSLTPAGVNATKIIDVPAGPVQVILNAYTSGAAVSYGPNQASLATGNGAIVNAGQSITINVPLGAVAQTLYGTGIGGTAIISATTSAPN